MLENVLWSDDIPFMFKLRYGCLRDFCFRGSIRVFDVYSWQPFNSYLWNNLIDCSSSGYWQKVTIQTISSELIRKQQRY